MNTEKKSVFGRPKLYKDRETLQAALEDYFSQEHEFLTITGLCLHLGFKSRTTMLNYQKDPEVGDLITHAKTLVENDYEKRLVNRGTAGDIFGLKNFGWTDKQVTEHQGGVEVTQVTRKIV